MNLPLNLKTKPKSNAKQVRNLIFYLDWRLNWSQGGTVGDKQQASAQESGEQLTECIQATGQSFSNSPLICPLYKHSGICNHIISYHINLTNLSSQTMRSRKSEGRGEEIRNEEFSEVAGHKCFLKIRFPLYKICKNITNNKLQNTMEENSTIHNSNTNYQLNQLYKTN